MARTSNKSAEIKEQTAEVETKTEVVDAAESDKADSTPKTEETKKTKKAEDSDTSNDRADTGSTEVHDNTAVDDGVNDSEDTTVEEPVNDNIIADEGPIIADNEVRIQFAPINIVYPINAYAGPSESMLVGMVAGWMNIEIDTTSEFVHFEKAQGAGVICGYIRRSDIR